MDFIGGFASYLLPFLIVLTVLVFVHELGHYWVARRNGVRVEIFSIGFGPEIFGFNDRAGTRWKFSVIPLGGYVKMFGDAGVASTPGGELPTMTADERAESFHHKRVGQRAAIVAAGPAANFIFSILLLAALFMTSGHPFPAAVVGSVVPGSPAEQAGFQPGDEVVSVAGRPADRFAELSGLIQAAGPGPIEIDIEREGEESTLSVTPEFVTVEGADGQPVEILRVGIGAESGPFGILRSVGMGVSETFTLSAMTLSAVGEMITGERSTEELGGPLRIAQMSGDVAQVGIIALLWFMAILSINLGLINLFPVPMLDGGHLLFYAVEAIRGRPLGERAQEYGFRVGLALVLTLMIFATWNDLVQLKVVAYVKNLIS
ncbi:RIP metalloprotease RseP [Inquilinus sp. CAU 1745]|uniref:RIP metalloprotease RseP n=1 Tax=Inquilinus sp. CAU 1745 TaxID=3140369 RepID=UPI00325AB0A3